MMVKGRGTEVGVGGEQRGSGKGSGTEERGTDPGGVVAASARIEGGRGA